MRRVFLTSVCLAHLSLFFGGVSAQTEIPRGFRLIAQEAGDAQIGIGLVGETVGPESIFERLPLDVVVLEAHAYRWLDTDPISVEEVPADLLPPVIEGDVVVQEIHTPDPGVVGLIYFLNRPLMPHETIIGGMGVTGTLPIDNLFDSPIDDILEQLDRLQQRIYSWVNDKLCTAFSIIPSDSSSFYKDCEDTIAPHPVTFENRFGPTTMDANEGVAAVSLTLASHEALRCSNHVGVSFLGTPITPGVLAESHVGTAFQIIAQDMRNHGKRAKATVRIRGGGTGSDPFGFENFHGVLALNPTLPLPPPAPPGSPVIPAGSAVSDLIVIEFGPGMGTAFVPAQSRHLDSAFQVALTAAAFSCDSDNVERGTAYDESFDTYLFDGAIYEARAAHCVAGLTIGLAETWYYMHGNSLAVLNECTGAGPGATFATDSRSNQRRGLRLEDVQIDYHHIDLNVVSMSIDDVTPLDGVISQVIARVRNDGSAPAYSIRATLSDNGVPRGIWAIPYLPAGADETLRFAWDTTGLFGTGPHTLSVYVESLTIAELEYGNNTGTVGPVWVQPSIKAAFVTSGRTVSSSCGDCGRLDVFDTQSLHRIGTIDLRAAMNTPDPRPRAIAVPNAGTTAWLVTERHPSRFTFGLSGIDVMSCYSGICQLLASPTPGPTPWHNDAAGGVAVRADGAFAFVPYNTRSGAAALAAYPLSLSGAGTPRTELLPFSTETFDPRTKSAVAIAPSGTGREELYVVGGHNQLGWARVFRVPVSDRDFRTEPIVIERYDMALPPASGDCRALAVEYSAEQQQGIGAVWGQRAVLTDLQRSSFITFDTSCPELDSTVTYAPPCVEGRAAVATGPLLAELTSARDGWSTDASVPTSSLLPDVYWGIDPQQPNDTPTVDGAGCAGFSLRCDGIYADIALGFPVERVPGTGLKQEFWLADQGANLGGIDIFERGSPSQVLGLMLQAPAEGITIAPIPLDGDPWVFPPPFPWPGPWPVEWPPGVEEFWNLVRIPAIEVDEVHVQVPLLNDTEATIDLDLALIGLPQGWQATWDPAETEDVPPFEQLPESLRFVDVALSTPGWFEQPVTFGVRAFPATGVPTDGAIVFMRATNVNGVARRDDDGTLETTTNLRELGHLAMKSIEVHGETESLQLARVWLHANALEPLVPTKAPDFQVMVNEDPAQTLIFDPDALLDGDPLTYQWISVDVPTAWLRTGLNDLRIEPALPQPVNGLALGVDLHSDLDRSWWLGETGGCPGDPVACAGELMVLLELSYDCNGDGLLDHVELRSGLSEDVDGDGLLDRCTGAVGVDEAPRHRAVALGAYPNPFNPRVTFRFALEASSWAELVVFDLRGKRVATVWRGELDGGDTQLVWDGRDDDGREVSSGVYIARMVAGERLDRCKVVLLR